MCLKNISPYMYRQDIFADKIVVNIYPIHHSQKAIYGFMMCIQNLSSHATFFYYNTNIFGNIFDLSWPLKY